MGAGVTVPEGLGVILLLLVLLPVLAAIAAYFVTSARRRSAILLGTAAAHTTLVLLLWLRPQDRALAGWLAADDLGRVVVSLVSVLFLAVAHYTAGYFRREETRAALGGRIFVSVMLAFLAATSLVALSHHLALLWIGMESTTLAVAPLALDRGDRRSLEAMWKYLMLSSVGIALALLGIFLLATAQPSGATGGRPLVLDDMIAVARRLDPAWLRAAFVFIVVGFGTKMGLAPMHAWKPDIYGQTSGLVGALMAGALTSCAFLGVARVASICFAAGQGAFVRPVLIGFGLLSLVIASAFIVGQRDIRRLLAYSSVEHMGLLVLGLGVGGAGAYGSVLHTLNNGFAKASMFLLVGNVLLATGTTVAEEIRGLLRAMPATAVLLVAGLFALTGAPPFALFLSEFSIIRGAFAEGHPWVAGVTLLLLAVIFVGIASMILEIIYAPAPEGAPLRPRERERSDLMVAPAALAALLLVLGVYIPAPLAAALASAARVLGGSAP